MTLEQSCSRVSGVVGPEDNDVLLWDIGVLVVVGGTCERLGSVELFVECASRGWAVETTRGVSVSLWLATGRLG